MLFSMITTLQQQTEFWQDPNIIGWTAIAVTIMCAIASTIATFVTTSYSVNKQNKRKEITYRIRDDSPIFVDTDLKDKLTIMLNGKPITDLSSLTLNIWNSGEVAVKSEDYIHPIIAKFEGRIIQDADLWKWYPNNLVTSADINDFNMKNVDFHKQTPNSILLPTLHLNSEKGSGVQNSYIIRVLLTGSGSTYEIDGTLNDGKITEFISQNKSKTGQFIQPLISFAFSFIFIVMALLIFGIMHISTSNSLTISILAIISAVLSIFLFLFNFYYNILLPKRESKKIS